MCLACRWCVGGLIGDGGLGCGWLVVGGGLVGDDGDMVARLAH